MNDTTKNKHDEILTSARNVLDKEADALKNVAKSLDGEFVTAVEHILGINGRLIVAGIGKSGIVGRKIAATLASTGTPAYFLHPAEGFHGDLGLILPHDTVMLISHSGETEEILNLLPSLRRIGNKLISITKHRECTLARKCNISLITGTIDEADPMNMVPTSSAIATMALGDALSVALLIERGFKEGDFAQFHPGGSLGKKLLLRLCDLAFEGDDNPKVCNNANFRDAQYILMKKHLGAVSIVDQTGKLVGIITDGDVRRLLEHNQNTTISEIMNFPVKDVMT
ncbi:MAG: KpsF/GutQ family sugar-phosphate isomerase, partial [bacterium]